MKIRINPKDLTESPYTCLEEESESSNPQVGGDEKEEEKVDATTFFHFDDLSLKSLADELINSNPTSLMISGFRGAGKTSFIERIEELLKHKQTRDKRPTVFVKLNFSKYEEHRYVIRKLIRNLYLSIKNKPKFIELKDQAGDSLKPNGAQKLESLYKKTYLDVQTQLNIKNETSQEVSTEISWSQKLGPIVEAGLGAGAAGALLSGLQNEIGKYALGGLLGIFSLLKLVEIKKTFTEKKRHAKAAERMEKTIYDDEIADFLFRDLLKSLDKHFRLVFVLDELDKIQDVKEIDMVINELKPFLLAGSCNFILVTGQDLYYRFFNSSFESDPVLSSIFSRTHHVSLPPNMITMVDQFLTQVSKDKGDGDFFYDLQRSLVFDSHRIPRKLVAKIRQLISRSRWLETEEVFELELSARDQSIFMRNKTLEEAIANVIPSLSLDGTLNSNPPLKDLFISQLYIWANRLSYLEENTDHPTSLFLDKVEPWATKLSNLNAKRQVFLEVFLIELTRTGYVKFDEEAQTFSIDWELDKKATTAKPTVKPKPKKSTTKKPKDLPKANEDTEEKSKDKSLAVPEEQTLEPPSAVREEATPAKRTRNKRDQEDFQDTYEKFIALATAIFKSLAEIEKTQHADWEQDDAVAPPDPIKELQPDYTFTFDDLELHPFIMDVLKGKHKRLLSKLSTHNDEGLLSSDIGSAADLVEMQRMHHTLLVGYVGALPHVMQQIDFHTHWQESVALEQQRIPNVDLLVESFHQDLDTVALKVLMVEELKALDPTVVRECVDFLRRINKITGKQHKLLLLVYSETTLQANDPTVREYQQTLIQTLRKNSEFIPYIELEVVDQHTLGEVSEAFLSVRQDKVVSFNSESVIIDVHGDVKHELLNGDYGRYLHTQGGGAAMVSAENVIPFLAETKGNLWLNLCRRRIEEVKVVLVMDLFHQQSGEQEVKGFLLVAHGMDKEQTNEQFLKRANAELPVMPIKPQRWSEEGDWSLDQYNIYEAFENSYWKPYLINRIVGLEIIGNDPKSSSEIGYMKFHFDSKDMIYEGLGLFYR